MNSMTPSGGPQPMQPRTTANYQSGFTGNRQAVNTGYENDRLAKESMFTPQHGSPTGILAAQQLSKSQAMNNAAQANRAMAGANAQQQMADQATRSELLQAGLSNQAKIYSDISQRAVDQTSLAAQLQEAMIRNRFALAQALIQ